MPIVKFPIFLDQYGFFPGHFARTEKDLPSGVDFPSEAWMPNSNDAMASKHFLRWGWTASGFLVCAKISNNSSLDKKYILKNKIKNVYFAQSKTIRYGRAQKLHSTGPTAMVSGFGYKMSGNVEFYIVLFFSINTSRDSCPERFTVLSLLWPWPFETML